MVGWAKAGAGEEWVETQLSSVPWPWRRETLGEFESQWPAPEALSGFRFLTWPWVTSCWICLMFPLPNAQGWHESSPTESFHHWVPLHVHTGASTQGRVLQAACTSQGGQLRLGRQLGVHNTTLPRGDGFVLRFNVPFSLLLSTSYLFRLPS